MTTYRLTDADWPDRAISSVRRFADRGEIEAAGFVPGWHGEPVNVGDAVVIHGHNGWRQAVATKVTPTYVHAIFVTPTNVEQAQKLSVSEANLNVPYIVGIVRKQELENGAYFVRAVAEGRGRYQSDAQWAAYQAYADMGPEAYADMKAEKERESLTARVEKARSGGWQQYVTVVAGKGDRTGTKGSNLYVLPA